MGQEKITAALNVVEDQGRNARTRRKPGRIRTGVFHIMISVQNIESAGFVKAEKQLES